MTSLKSPPFRIYLLRHADAEQAEKGQGDLARPLSRYGLDEAEAVAEQAVEKGYRPDIILASPARRCRETVDVFRRAFDGSVEIRYLDALYHSGPNGYLDIVASQVAESSVMLVGHNPTIEQTLSGLVGQQTVSARLPLGYPTAGLAVLSARLAAPQTQAEWMLSDFVTKAG